MRRKSLILVACLLAAPWASAGTAADPEFTDPSGDQELSDAGFAGLDISQGWIDHTETDLLFFLEMHNAASPGSTTQYEWWFEADVGGEALSLGVVGLNGGGYEAAGDTTSFDVSGGLIAWTVPRAEVGAVDGTVVSMLYAHADGYGASGGDPRLSTDRGPDDGFGREYTVSPPTPTEPATVFRNVTEPELRIEAEYASPTNASAVYNWTGPANVTLTVVVDGSGSVDLKVLDPTGGEQYACACEDGVNETTRLSSEAGTWTVEVDYRSFNGSAMIVLDQALLSVEAGVGDGNGTDDPGDGNTTTETEDEGAPWPFVAPLAAVGLAAWAVRRRG